MKLKIFAILLLAVVGLAAVAYTVIPSSGSASGNTKYVTANAAVTDVVNQVVATGSVQPVAVYSLAFGSQPVLTSSGSASSSSSSSSSSSNGSSSGSSATWDVVSVSVAPGATVTKGQELASADASDARLGLTVAKANLAAAAAKQALDTAGLNPTDRAAAHMSVTQAQQSLSQARTARSQTIAQNNLRLAQQTKAVSRAKSQLAADQAAPAPGPDPAKIAQDEAAVTSATDALASLKLQVAQSNSSAANQVTAASNQVTSAQLGYKSKTVGATAAALASDDAAVASAQQAVNKAQAAVDAGTLTSPVDGVVLAVNVTPGVVAPSGPAVTVQASGYQVAASVAETDLPSLKLGQTADITVTATKLPASGTVTQIYPAGTAASGGGVVSYPIVVAMPTAPAGTASGMSAQVSITTASAPNVLAVPSIALVGSSGGYDVRTLDASGQPQLTPVEVGLITSSMAEIKSGISAGTAVVVGTSSTRQGTTTTAGGLGGGLGGGALGGGGFGGGRGNGQ
jgi:multidrug efflux pump subunit AcrA (membrane-fusion protein)